MDLGERLKVIERLGRLHAQGALSDEEFAAEKARLLGTGEPPRDAPEAPVRVAEAVPPDQGAPDHGGGYQDDSSPTAKWAGAAAALLLVLGGGYWLTQSGSAAPADALSDAQATSAGAEAGREPPISRAQLVGSWTPDDSCISDAGFDLGADGIVGYEDGEGRWSVEGRQLVTVDEGERTATPILSLAGDRLALRHADGSTTSFRRCTTAQVAAAKAAAEADASLDSAAAALEAAGQAVEAAISDFTADEQQAILAYEQLNSKCRGGSGDEASTMQACERRDAAGDALERRGICYGKRTDQASAEMQHHRCGPDSLRSGG